MSLRTLRIMVAGSIIMVLFIYLASSQVSVNLPIHQADEGLEGGPLPGLTKNQLVRFNRGKELFHKKMTVADGLGPVFNGQSCADCHGGWEKATPENAEIWIAKLKPGNESKTPAPNTPEVTKPDAAKGTPAPTNPDTKAVSATGKKEKGKEDNKGKSANKENGTNKAETPAALAKVKTLEQNLDYFVNAGGPALIKKSITDLPDSGLPADCKLAAIDKPPAGTDYISTRLPAPLYGAGLLDSVADTALQFGAANQYNRKNLIKGKLNRVSPRVAGWTDAGRWGAKSEVSTLYGMCAKHMAWHLGITTPLYPDPMSPGAIPDCVKQVLPADPNNNGQDLMAICFYVSLLAPPPRAEISKAAQRGAIVFQKLSCAQCHVPELHSQQKVYLLDPNGPALPLQRIAGSTDLFEQNGDTQSIELRPLESKEFQPYTDLLLHEMGAELADGLGQGKATGQQWRTPPLWGLRHKKLYLHDGRADKLEKAIALHGGEARPSAEAFSKLEQKDKDDLISFLKSL